MCYGQQGNCKFGPKCANVHVLPDGRRINYSKNGVTIGAPPIPSSRATATHGVGYHMTNSALTNSFLRADGVPPYTNTYPYQGEDKYHTLARQPSLGDGLPGAETAYSHPNSAYGSPRDDERLSLGLSPVAKGLSVLDAPLPASFDSNGISMAARYGPWPASMPSKFGVESPSPLLNPTKDPRPSETLKLLHTSAFGSSEHLNLSPSPASGLPGSASIPGGTAAGTGGSSPPTGPPNEEYFGKRAMHSSRALFLAKHGGHHSKMLSSSLPKPVSSVAGGMGIDRDWDASFPFLEEADYVPDNLKDLLTPSERARRGSLRTAAENGASNGEGGTVTSSPAPGADSPASNANSSGAIGATTKYGSPLPAGSPSRWAPIFARKDADDIADGASTSSRRASAFGHVGSPLRNSSLASMPGESTATAAPGSAWSGRPGVGGRSTSETMSALTQQLQRTRVSDDYTGSAGSSNHYHAHHHNGTSSPGGNSPRLHPQRRDARSGGTERHVSTGSIGSVGGGAGGRFSTPIEEEDSSFVFSMDEVDGDSQPARSSAQRKRGSTGWTYAAALAGGAGRPSIGGVVGGKPEAGEPR